MKSLKFNTDLLVAKSIAKGMQLLKKEASSFPGMIAMKLDKNFLTITKNYCSKKIINVTGTNGKTTTSSLLADMLRAGNQSVIHNFKGANMPQGLATALVDGINPLKKSDYFVFETDEAYLSKVYDSLKADYLLVTNLFQDQTDRYGGMDFTAKKIREAIDKNSELTVVLNADDPVLQQLYTDKILTFGFENIELNDNIQNESEAGESVFCTCGKPLNFTKRFYSHIGHYSCSCGVSRKQPDVLASAKISKFKTELKITYQDKDYEFVLSMPGLYNAYNATGAIAMALILGIAAEDIQLALDEYKTVFGRANKFTLKGKDVFAQLIKNPAGANEAIRAICNDDNTKLLIMINNEYSDGRDISWLWDSNFELLENYKGTIFVSGKCAYDTATRLKYTNFDYKKIKIIPDIETALNEALNSLNNEETLNILPTYTALAKVQELIKNHLI